ncbi:MAG: substrate-binding domain-containing protein [Bacteroidota bacterium]
MKPTGYLILAFATLQLACGSPDKNGKNMDTATSGTITIAADESLRPIVEAEVEVFESLYPAAHLNVIYTNEYDAMQLLVKDSARIAITSRELLPEEKAVLDKATITARYAPFCKDAIAIIMNKDSKDTILNMQQVKAILDGTYTTWKDLNAKNPVSPIQVVFDSPKSGAVRHLKDSVLNGKELAKHCFAVSDNKAVIDYVETHANSIGLIGVSWISDRDDSTSNSFMNRIHVVSLVPVNPETAESTSMKPFQAYVALKQYPLWRTVQITLREPRVGLGTGFASFVASDSGQRIVLKSGLVPATAPIRIIDLK